MHSDAMGNGLSRDVEKIIIACAQACTANAANAAENVTQAEERRRSFTILLQVYDKFTKGS